MKRNGMFLVLTIITLAFTGTAMAQLTPCADVPFEACGGDLTGTWSYQTILCMNAPDPTTMFPGCVGAEIQLDAAVAGQTVFTAEGSYVEEMLRSMAMVITVPLTCLPAGTNCTDLAASGGLAVTAGESCVLLFTKAETDNESGTYTVTDATATLVDGEDGDIDEGSYCIDGDEMVVRIDDDGGMAAMILHHRVQ